MAKETHIKTDKTHYRLGCLGVTILFKINEVQRRRSISDLPKFDDDLNTKRGKKLREVDE
jgi:hypothetical protein